MALLPDLAAAALYAVVVFLLALGFLVVFVETLSPRRLTACLVGALILGVAFASLGELGLGLLVAGGALAFLANHAFEWLTAR